MALTGLQIYKLLPKTNCKKCGFPTCLAFAMKLSQKGAELSACPDVSDRMGPARPNSNASSISNCRNSSAFSVRLLQKKFLPKKCTKIQPA